MVRVLGALWLALCGCNAGSPGTPLDASIPADAQYSNGECGPTLKPAGRACVPLLDTCPGNQVPTPGGGCKQVGVEECKTAEGELGIKGPPGLTCKRLGPPTTCLAGWAMTEHGWCEPVLPEADCPDGTIEVIGKADCQPMADCGSGIYGNIVVTADTVFVDVSYSGSDSDGSQAKPFATIGQALQAAPADRQAHIAVGPGVYKENVLIVNRPVVLEGRCPQKVTMKGKVQTEGSEVTLRGLTVQSPGMGVLVLGGVVELDRVGVLDCEGIGVMVSGGAKVSVQDSVVARIHSYYGIYVLDDGTCAEVDRTVVRGTAPLPGFGGGIGVRARDGAKLTLRDSVVSDNHYCGVSAWEATAKIERSVIQRSPVSIGIGIQAVAWGEMDVVDTLVASNHLAGIWVSGWSNATVKRTVIRDTRTPTYLPVKSLGQGEGILVSDSSLVLRDSVVASNTSAGVSITAGDATVERTLVVDTLPRADNTGGHGIEVSYRKYGKQPTATLVLTDSIVASSHDTGVVAYASDAKLERSLVQKTLPRESDGAYGIGVLGLARLEPHATLPATVSIVDSTITDSAFSGVAVYGSQATVEGSVVRDTREPKPRRWGGPGVLVSSLGTAASTLELTGSLVEENSDFGVFIAGGTATLERSAIRDTRTRLGDKAGGVGVYAWPGTDEVSTKLQLHDCQVSKSGTAGIYVSDAPLDVQRCEVTSTAGDGAGRFGDGIVAAGNKKLLVLDSLVSDSLRCGLLAKGTGGLVDRSMLTKGYFSVMVEGGAQLEIGPRVELFGNIEDRVSYGDDIGTPPPPVLPPPPKMPEPPEPDSPEP